MVLCSVPEKRRRVQQSLRPNLNHNFKSFGTGESFYLSNSPYTIAPAGLDQATRRVEQPFLSDAETIYQTMKPLALPEDRLASPTNRRGSSDLLGQPEADQSQQAIRFWLRSAASRTSNPNASGLAASNFSFKPSACANAVYTRLNEGCRLLNVECVWVCRMLQHPWYTPRLSGLFEERVRSHAPHNQCAILKTKKSGPPQLISRKPTSSTG